MRRQRPPSEMTIFLPNQGADPVRSIAEQLVAVLPAGRVETGIDLLTGNIELRLYYDAEVLRLVEAWLDERGIDYDVSFL